MLASAASLVTSHVDRYHLGTYSTTAAADEIMARSMTTIAESAAWM